MRAAEHWMHRKPPFVKSKEGKYERAWKGWVAEVDIESSCHK
jgi:hypothetical protein